jgi:hypothetical protein
MMRERFSERLRLDLLFAWIRGLVLIYASFVKGPQESNAT